MAASKLQHLHMKLGEEALVFQQHVVSNLFKRDEKLMVFLVLLMEGVLWSMWFSAHKVVSGIYVL